MGVAKFPAQQPLAIEMGLFRMCCTPYAAVEPTVVQATNQLQQITKLSFALLLMSIEIEWSNNMTCLTIYTSDM